MGRKIQKKPRKRKITFPVKLVLILALLFILTAVVRINFKLTSITFEGSTRYTDEELKALILPNGKSELSFMLYLESKFGNEVTIPFVERYDVDMVDKNSVRIQVYEKTVIGCVEVMGGYMYFDKDGIIVESVNEPLDGIPIISGLKFSKIVLHEELEVQKKSIFEVILNLTRLINKNELLVDKVYFNSSLEVTLYSNDCRILLGKRDTYDVQIAALKSVLKSAEGMKLSFDMRNYTEKNTDIIATPIE
ncbi:MAG: cell division protein FtsQ [Lachnospiraceae bacterium]|nr:cell division protein FtsQ [Lachnospiraceae bacterium]